MTKLQWNLLQIEQVQKKIIWDLTVGKTHQIEDWAKRLNAFLQFNEYDLLHNSGKVTAEVANLKQSIEAVIE